MTVCIDCSNIHVLFFKKNLEHIKVVDTALNRARVVYEVGLV